jgi:Protein of unknown function (DUF2846)
MKTIVGVMLFAVCAFAQEPAVAAAACGPKTTRFDVKRDNSQHTMGRPEAGKALIYFVQDIGVATCLGSCITTKIGVDGKWVGAIQHNSYFSVSVDPGEHHLCANPQALVSPIKQLVALEHFEAEAGKVYYFRTRAFGGKDQILFDFQAVDSDQAEYLIASFPLSVSHPK